MPDSMGNMDYMRDPTIYLGKLVENRRTKAESPGISSHPGIFFPGIILINFPINQANSFT